MSIVLTILSWYAASYAWSNSPLKVSHHEKKSRCCKKSNYQHRSLEPSLTYRRRSSEDQAPDRVHRDGHLVRVRLRLALHHPRGLVARCVVKLSPFDQDRLRFYFENASGCYIETKTWLWCRGNWQETGNPNLAEKKLIIFLGDQIIIGLIFSQYCSVI